MCFWIRTVRLAKKIKVIMRDIQPGSKLACQGRFPTPRASKNMNSRQYSSSTIMKSRRRSAQFRGWLCRTQVSQPLGLGFGAQHQLRCQETVLLGHSRLGAIHDVVEQLWPIGQGDV